mmetsp:Transcript_60399/g.118861  ORF Transcript_60399/g.118861 Transcript_60399/m.118861 type:complete len:247 (+) Transcript_60399:735-1475(+)
MPSFVASRTACINSSCMLSKEKVKAQSKMWPSTCRPRSSLAISVGCNHRGASPGLTVSWAATSFKDNPTGKAMPRFMGFVGSKPKMSRDACSTISTISFNCMPGRTERCTYCRTCRCASAPSRRQRTRCCQASSSSGPSNAASFAVRPKRCSQNRGLDEEEDNVAVLEYCISCPAGGSFAGNVDATGFVGGKVCPRAVYSASVGTMTPRKEALHRACVNIGGLACGVLPLDAPRASVSAAGDNTAE